MHPLLEGLAADDRNTLRAGLAAARADWPAAWAGIAEGIEAFGNPSDRVGVSIEALHIGLLLAGAERETRAYRPLCALARDTDAMTLLFGDSVASLLASILAGVFDGDLAPGLALLLDPAAEEFIRTGVLDALTLLVATDRLPRATLEHVLHRLFIEQAMPAGEFIWFSWQRAIAVFGLTGLVPLVEAAFRDGRLSREITTPEHFGKDLRDAAAPGFDLLAELARDNVAPLTDARIEALCFPAPRKPYRKPGRNDPCPCGSGKKYKKCCAA